MQKTKQIGPGRPRLMAKTRRIIIQIDDTQLKTIQRVVKTNNMSVSQFIRTAAEHYLNHSAKADK